jgi:hypothetical protein
MIISSRPSRPKCTALSRHLWGGRLQLAGIEGARKQKQTAGIYQAKPGRKPAAMGSSWAGDHYRIKEVISLFLLIAD